MFDLNKLKGPRMLWMGVAVLIGLLLLNAGKLVKPPGAPATVEQEAVRQTESVKPSADEVQMEQRLEQILSQVEGVGKVSVRVSLVTGPAYEYAVNASTVKKTVDENDQEGGNRTTTENTENDQVVLVRSPQSGMEQPVVIKEHKPKIQGVLVVAEGAGSSRTKVQIIQAIQTVLDIELHKISVLPREGR